MKPLIIITTTAIAVSVGLSLTLSYYGKVLEINEKPETDTPLTKLACGSCFKPNYQGADDIWKTIAKTKPQAFLFMGDNIYADTEDMDVTRKKYQELTELPSYADFSSTIPIIPIWDDHDYGKNDAGAEYPKKAESQQIFLDAFDFPMDHPARTQEGIYHSITQGPEGSLSSQ